MKRIGIMLVALGWLAHAAPEANVLTWRDEDKKEAEAGKWALGQGLLENEAFPEETATIQAEAAIGELDKAATEEFPPLPEDVLIEYFAKKPAVLLLDPQHLLPQVVYREQYEFIQGHAADSSSDLVVFVFDGQRELPGAARAEEVIERFYAKGRPTALVYYFTDAPKRTRLFFNSPLADRLTPLEQQRMLNSAVAQTMGKNTSAEQLEALTRQLSIRLYLLDDAPKLAALAATAKRPEPKAPKVSAFEKLKAKLPPQVQEQLAAWLPPAAVACAGVVVLVGGAACLRWRSRCRFPHPACEARLGGEFAAGIGATIDFSPRAGSPTEQRPLEAGKF